MDTQKYTRRPFEVEAVQVTPKNVEQVAEWCGGTVTLADYKLMGGIHKMGAVLLPKQGPRNNKTHTVLIGQWITKHNASFRSWSKDAFENTFAVLLKPGDMIRASEEGFEGWEGVVMHVNLTGVSFGARGNVVFEPDFIERITTVSSTQVGLNAGAEGELQTVNGLPPVEDVLDKMRADSREKIAAMEAENLQTDPASVRLQDLQIDKLEGMTVADARKKLGMEPTGVPEVDNMPLSEEAKAQFELMKENCKVKVDQLVKVVDASSSYHGQCGHVKAVDSEGLVVGFATADLDKEELVSFMHGSIVPVEDGEPAINFSADVVTEAIESAVAEARKELDLSAWTIEGLGDLEVSDIVEIDKDGHERHGQNAMLTVIGVEMFDGSAGVEVKYSDGEYDCFKPTELKKI